MSYSKPEKIPERSRREENNPDNHANFTDASSARSAELDNGKMPLTPAAIIDALITTLEVAMGRRPVMVTVNVPVRRGRTVIHQKRVSEVFMPDGRVAASVLKLLGQEVGMYKGASTPREPIQWPITNTQLILALLRMQKRCELSGEWTAEHQKMAETILKPAHEGDADGDSEGQS